MFEGGVFEAEVLEATHHWPIATMRAMRYAEGGLSPLQLPAPAKESGAPRVCVGWEGREGPPVVVRSLATSDSPSRRRSTAPYPVCFAPMQRVRR